MSFESADNWVILTVDASSKGFGVVFRQIALFGCWSEKELMDHINVLELTTVLKILIVDLEVFRNA